MKGEQLLNGASQLKIYRISKAGIQNNYTTGCRSNGMVRSKL